MCAGNICSPLCLFSNKVAFVTSFQKVDRWFRGANLERFVGRTTPNPNLLQSQNISAPLPTTSPRTCN